DGTITKVELFDGNQKLAEDSNAPFTFTLNNVSPGTLNLRAQAIDNDQAMTSSGTVQVTVESAGGGQPQEVILRPIQDAYLEGSNGLNNAFLKLEQGFRVSYLKFDLSGISGEISQAQLQLTVSTDAGNGKMEVLLGNSNSWSETNINPNNAPSAGILLGSLNTSYNLNQTYTWNLDAAQLSGGGELSLVIRQTSGTSDAWFSSKEGNQAPQLILTTNGSNNPPANQAPTVNITSPQNGTSFVEGDNITVSVAANDSDGSITKVELFDGGQKIAEKNNAPYTFTLNGVSSGTLNLSAQATDDDGASASSSVVQVEIEASSSEPQNITLGPIQDAYIEGSQGLNNTFLKVEQGFRTSYLKFDLSSISGD
ncbi:MAG: Ig-like domain-containing protein, partial [Bacteroidota bacterium]